MKIYLGNTDLDWFQYLSRIKPDDVNFWQPGGKISFKYLDSGSPFLFRLKKPINKIAGVGFFSSHTFLPINMAWEVFLEKNGASTYHEFYSKILEYREDKTNSNPVIGCIVLTNPIFFEEQDWLESPANWSPTGIVQGKGYETNEYYGAEIWKRIEVLLEKYLQPNEHGNKSQLILEETESPRYGNAVLRKVRLGQGAFRVLVTDAYQRRCSISGERTLPVLEAAHIKPYSLSGPHFISNSLLLRSDLHKLFDTGYITITKEYKIEVSKRIKEEFENGKDYYQYHGKNLSVLPLKKEHQPEIRYIEWHNEQFLGNF